MSTYILMPIGLYIETHNSRSNKTVIGSSQSNAQCVYYIINIGEVQNCVRGHLSYITLSRIVPVLRVLRYWIAFIQIYAHGHVAASPPTLIIYLPLSGCIIPGEWIFRMIKVSYCSTRILHSFIHFFCLPNEEGIYIHWWLVCQFGKYQQLKLKFARRKMQQQTSTQKENCAEVFVIRFTRQLHFTIDKKTMQIFEGNKLLIMLYSVLRSFQSIFLIKTFIL